MEANKKTELINQTIQKLIEETKKKKSNKDVDDELLSTLLSQVLFIDWLIVTDLCYILLCCFQIQPIL